MSDDRNHDTAHELAVAARAALDAGDTATAIATSNEALDLFWEVDEPCNGIAETLSLIGSAYVIAGDIDAARDVRFNNLLNFIGDSDYDELIALMDIARQATDEGDLMSARIHWLAAAAVAIQVADDVDGHDQAATLASFALEQADAYEHDDLVADFITEEDEEA